jgi:hypothetical protein
MSPIHFQIIINTGIYYITVQIYYIHIAVDIIIYSYYLLVLLNYIWEIK